MANIPNVSPETVKQVATAAAGAAIVVATVGVGYVTKKLVERAVDDHRRWAHPPND